MYQVRPIGWVRKSEGRATIEIEPRYQPALLGVDELDSIWVLYWLDRNDNPEGRSILRVHPRRNPENPLRGVFATRAPRRPNPIGLTVVRLLRVEDATLHVAGVDVLDGTPLLDLKPYVPAFDAHAEARDGWLGPCLDAREDGAPPPTADDRFHRGT